MVRLIIIAAALAGAAFAQGIPGGSSQTGGMSLACVATPGNTAGAYRTQCQASNGAVYSCNTAGGCTVAADWVNIGGGASSLGTGVATFLATPTSANFAAAITDETGTGAVVLATSPALVTPALGTPASGVMTNVTGLPPAAVTSAQGNGAKFQLSTGTTTTNDCVKFDANGNTVDAGSACGAGGGGVNFSTPGASHTFTTSADIFVCTTTCTITVPVPVAGVQYCVMNDDNIATVITMSAIGSSARYENTARTAYGTAGTGTFVSGGAAGDMVCMVGRDSTHYLTATFKGTWTAN